MSFKNDKQRRMLFAIDKNKSNPTKINLTAPAAKYQTGTKVNSIKNVVIPSLPGLKKMPKFARIKKFFKKTV